MRSNSCSKILLLLDQEYTSNGPTFLSHKLSSFPPQNVIMFTRLYNIFKQIQPSAVICLCEQYRMRHEVADVVNCITYSGDDILITPSTGNWRRTLKHPSFLLFSGEKWIESKKNPTMSCFNEAEANFGINLVMASLRLAGFDFQIENFFVVHNHCRTQSSVCTAHKLRSIKILLINIISLPL